MNIFGINSYKSILGIREFAKKENATKKRSDLRRSVKIAVIDDEKFHGYSNLKNYGYDIHEFQDISNISEIEEYDIILCDLMGVGRHFDASVGGASIISEITKNYPTKIVIAYTGARTNSAEAIAANEHCDHFLKKDADLTEWRDVLDRYVDQVTNPYEMWIVARDGLLDQEIDLRDILRLEDAYVRAILSKDTDFSQLKKQISKVDLNGHAKGVVHGLISSAIFSLLFA